MRVLPADIYDTLELSALAFGGIGKGRWWAIGGHQPAGADDIPVCIAGHAEAVDDGGFDVRLALRDAGIGFMLNDPAVTRINRRYLTRDPFTRVSWEEWCKELDVVRGE